MTFVVTQNCCNDATCVTVCPVNCIHPRPDEPDFATAEMLYIDPDTCIDCGACVDVCPVNAITPDFELTDPDAFYLDLNAQYFIDPSHQEYESAQFRRRVPAFEMDQAETLRVAVVGSGPSAMYAVEELTSNRGLDVEVTIVERLPTPWGLVRFGVAPDHQSTKSVEKLFMSTMRRPGISLNLNVEVGRDVTLDELRAHHHAVIWAGGAASDRRLAIPGEDLPGSLSATDFVGWYNGHPDYADLQPDLSGERAVIVGNGNVALDVARILATPAHDLKSTDIAPHALAALADSNIRQVVVLGRRGPAQAAFTTPELVGLVQHPSFDVTVRPEEIALDPASQVAVDKPGSMDEMKLRLLRGLDERPTNEREISLRFLGSPVEVLGESHVEGLRVARNDLSLSGDQIVARSTDATYDLECGLLLRSVGYRGTAVDGLPYEERSGTLPHRTGRVIDPATEKAVTGMYVAGWMKRGPSGVIGTNKSDSQETVRSLLDDYAAGRLDAPATEMHAFSALIAERQPAALALDDWKRIDKTERNLGRASGRPRTKLVSVEELVATARAPR
ncbi:MAG: ferredoxin/flavodoxin---NADP+ reductase [Nocardioidaceae bacterium]|nr:ferredoxin/flavodoxin---NADP+ reductase [Nocardioidaceae bacterium]